jgi:hypothetical protein
MVTLGARPQGLEYHRDYFSIGFPLRLRHRLSVHVHRGLDRGVTHEFLLDECLGDLSHIEIGDAEYSRIPGDSAEMWEATSSQRLESA